MTAIWVINLDRRRDRLDSFYAAHRGTTWESAKRWAAVDGKALVMTPELAKQLEPNDFFWKKSVTGCALSHIGLWKKLAAEPDGGAKTYLIMEDDARIQVPSLNFDELPGDYDVVYLGGILPHNRPVVNKALSGLPPSMRWVQVGSSIHFCAYAYVLSRAGARKLLAVLEARGGIYTSADLLICQNARPEGSLQIYMYNPMIAGCSQDNDPVYQKADFNNMLRVDAFDSDIWSNNERWREDEYGAYVRRVPAWAKKVGFNEINPGILNSIILNGQIPIIIGSLPTELKNAIPVHECAKDSDGWALIDMLERDIDMRNKYKEMLRKSIGIGG
jgi:GR25 family glycosyltransferase involved in LPS biosynthesis